jgi:hypothetical protein
VLPVGIVNQMLGGGGERLRDDEIGGGEAQQHQEEKVGRPATEQSLEHRDRTLAVRRLAGDLAIDRDRAAERHRHEDDGGDRREHAYRVKGNRRLITERAEIVHAGETHYPQPEALVFVRVWLIHSLPRTSA